MEALLEPLRELAEIEEIQNEKKKEAGLIQITGCVGSQKTHLTCALGSDCKYKLIVTSGESKAKQMYEENSLSAAGWKQFRHFSLGKGVQSSRHLMRLWILFCRLRRSGREFFL